MKKLAALLMILSLGLFTVGCGQPEATPPAKKDTTEKKADKAPDAAKTPAAKAPEKTPEKK